LRQFIADILFAQPDLIAYAIIDGAAMEELLDHLDGLRPEHVCLYRGELKPGVEEVAPYLVRLEPGSRFVDWLIESGWGNNFGVFVLTDQEMGPLRLHLRRHLRVFMEDGTAKTFRYYDFFGPVRQFLCENKGADAVDSFRLQGNALVHERTVEGNAPDWKPVSKPN
jgi:hypothetical protein